MGGGGVAPRVVRYSKVPPGVRRCRHEAPALRDPMWCFGVEGTLEVEHTSNPVNRLLLFHSFQRVSFVCFLFVFFPRACKCVLPF